MGWLHATPKDHKTSRKEQLEASSGEQSYLLDMPDLEGAEYLVGMWHEAGTVTQTGMGIVGLSWLEISSWVKECEMDIEVWEKLSIKFLSEQYAAEYSVASDPERHAPYSSVIEIEDIDRAAVAVKVGNVLRDLMKDNKRK